MGIIQEINKYKYTYFGFDPSRETKDDIWNAIPTIMGSNDAKNWNFIAYIPSLGNLRDGQISKINDVYYIWGTLACYTTKDFESFNKIDTSILENDNFVDVWAPEMFKDLNGNYHIIYGATTNGTRHIYTADFDISSGTLTNAFAIVDTPSSDSIDPTINIVDNAYYLQVSSGYKTNIYKSTTDFASGYSNYDTDIISQTANWYEAPEWLIDGEDVYMYQDKIIGYLLGIEDSGYMVYRTSKISDLSKWSDEKNVVSAMNMRHGSFIVN